MSRSSVFADMASQDVTAAELDKLDGVTVTTAQINAPTTLGTVTSGNISNTAIVYPAGHIVRTTQVHDKDVGSHISTTSTSPAASGIIVSTPVTTGSNYNIIHFSCSGYVEASQTSFVYLYANKNGAGYSLASGVHDQSGGIETQSGAAHHRMISATWVDTTGLTAGTNLYQIYIETTSSTFYLVHSGNDYQLIVQEIQG